MKGRVSIKVIALLLLFACAGAGRIASADKVADDAEWCNTDGRRILMNDAAKFEKAGKFRWALEWYANAYKWALHCGKGNQNDPLNIEIAESVKRIGKKLGAEEEKKGNLFDSALWFDATLNFADADRVAMNIAKKAEDLETFQNIVRHFHNRNGDKERFQKMSPGYTLDNGCFRALGQEAEKRGDAFLTKENEAFAKVINPVTGYKEAREPLRPAREWFRKSKDIEGWATDVLKVPGWSADAKIRQVIERAGKRGDALYADDTQAASLREAIEYYEFAGDTEESEVWSKQKESNKTKEERKKIKEESNKKIKMVKDKANRLGALNEKNGKLSIAIGYYQVADNEAKADELSETVKKNVKKSVKETIKGKEQQKKFKKEQDDLEKELGF